MAAQVGSSTCPAVDANTSSEMSARGGGGSKGRRAGRCQNAIIVLRRHAHPGGAGGCGS